MVAGIVVICIFGLLFSLTCYIKAKKLERRALIVLARMENKRQLENRFRGWKQNRPSSVDKSTRRARPSVKPARFV